MDAQVKWTKSRTLLGAVHQLTRGQKSQRSDGAEVGDEVSGLENQDGELSRAWGNQSKDPPKKSNRNPRYSTNNTTAQTPSNASVPTQPHSPKAGQCTYCDRCVDKWDIYQGLPWCRTHQWVPKVDVGTDGHFCQYPCQPQCTYCDRCVGKWDTHQGLPWCHTHSWVLKVNVGTDWHSCQYPCQPPQWQQNPHYNGQPILPGQQHYYTTSSGPQPSWQQSVASNQQYVPSPSTPQHAHLYPQHYLYNQSSQPAQSIQDSTYNPLPIYNNYSPRSQFHQGQSQTYGSADHRSYTFQGEETQGQLPGYGPFNSSRTW